MLKVYAERSYFEEKTHLDSHDKAKVNMAISWRIMIRTEPAGLRRNRR